MSVAHKKDTGPKILVFSSNAISDPGIDMAGSAHMHYSTAVQVIPVPCSSGIKPSWIVHAIEKGFDGVFVAACGGDCAFLADCTDRTSSLTKAAQDLMKERGLNPKRLKMSGICSVCADNFTNHMNKFQKELESLNAKSE
jgi:coenzyme F420-reducing hydrogenase delta subunit